MVWPSELRRDRGVRRAGGRLARRGFGWRRNAAAARDRAARRSPRPRIPSAPPTTRSCPRTSRRSATSRTSTSSAARPTSTRGRRPVRPWCARRTRRTRRASSCGGPRRPRASAATSSSRCSTRRTGSTSTSAGRWRTARWCATATPGSGITDKPIDVLALKKFDPARYGSLSFANPLALDDPRNCQNPVSSVDPTSAARGPPRTGWPGTSTARSARCVRSRDRANPLAYGGDRRDGWRGGHAARPSSTSTASATRRPAATSTTTSTPSTRSTWRATAGTRSTTATSWPSPAAHFVGIVPINQCEAVPRASATRACSSPTSACRSSTSCRSRTTCSASTPAVPTATRRPIASATTRWPAPRHATPDELNFSAASADIVKAGVAVPPMNCNEGPAQPLPEPHLLRRDAAQPRPVGALRDPRRRTPTRSRWRTARRRARRVRQRRRRPALALPRRADEHVVRQLDRRLVLLHRRPRGAVRRGDACSSSTRPTAPTSAPWSRTRRSSWPGATSPPTTASTSSARRRQADVP